MVTFGIGFRGVLFFEIRVRGGLLSRNARGVLNLFFGFRVVVYALHRRNNDTSYNDMYLAIFRSNFV